MLLAVCCDLGDVMRCALSSTSILSTMLQLTRCCLVFVRFCAGAADARKNRGDCELTLVVRADHAGVAERGGADAGAVRRWRRLRSIWLEELRAEGQHGSVGRVVSRVGSVVTKGAVPVSKK